MASRAQIDRHFFRAGYSFFLVKFIHLIERSLGLFTDPATHWSHLDRLVSNVNRMTDYPCHDQVASCRYGHYQLTTTGKQGSTCKLYKFQADQPIRRNYLSNNGMPKKCVVLVPVYQWPLKSMEMLSLVNTAKKLAEHDLVVVCPERVKSFLPLKIGEKTISSVVFNEKYFSSIAGYNKLLTSRKFYKCFSAYEYMLIVQLDALVISDQLNFWCEHNYSYIGAPWFVGFTEPEQPHRFLGVGNGGFSLRSCEDCIRVLSSLKCMRFSDKLIYSLARKTSPLGFLNRNVFKFNIHPLSPEVNEDAFWGILASSTFDLFKVPTPEVALRFAFEVEPRFLFKLSQGVLPFGCHAWEVYDRLFWVEQLGEEFFDS